MRKELWIAVTSLVLLTGAPGGQLGAAGPPVGDRKLSVWPVGAPRLVNVARERGPASAGRTVDWLLAVVVTSVDATPAAEARAMQAVPGAGGPPADVPTRWADLGDQGVVVLRRKGVPALDQLTFATDEYRLRTGQTPGLLLVFEYELASSGRRAVLTRQKDVWGPTLFTPASGWHRDLIMFKADLDDFLGKVDEVTLWDRKPGSSWPYLEGRKTGRKWRVGLSGSQAKVVWQAEGELLKLERRRADILADLDTAVFLRRQAQQVRAVLDDVRPRVTDDDEGLKLARQAAGKARDKALEDWKQRVSEVEAELKQLQADARKANDKVPADARTAWRKIARNLGRPRDPGDRP